MPNDPSRVPFDPGSLTQHDAWLRSLARVLVDDPDAAEDVAQDTMLRAIEAAPEQVTSMRSWLARVARNTVHMRRRAGGRRQMRERAAARADATPSAASIVEREAVRRAIVDAVLALDVRERDAILLRYFENLPPRRIAALTGDSRGAVESRLKRGLARLRARLDQSFDSRAVWTAAATGLGTQAAVVPAVLKGALVMGMKTKVAIGAAVVIIAVIAVFPSHEDEPRDEPPVEPRTVAPAVAGSRAPKNAARDERPASPRPAAPQKTVSAAPTQPSALANEKRSVVGRIINDSTGAPIEGAAVTLLNLLFPASESFRTKSDETGRFSIAVDLARYWMLRDVLVEADGLAPHQGFHTIAEAREGAPRTSGPIDLGDLRLVRGARVRGRVLDADGQPVVDARLFWVQHWHYGRFVPAGARAAGTSAGDGSFTLTDRLPPPAKHEHVLLAVSDGRLGWGSICVVRGQAEVVDATVRLRRTARVTVQVRDQSGQPLMAGVQAAPRFDPLCRVLPNLRGMRLRAWPIGPEAIVSLFSGKTDKQGTVAFDLPVLEDGAAYEFRAGVSRERGLAPSSTVVELAEDDERTITLTLRGVCKHCATGRVVAAEGSHPLEGVTVSTLDGRTTKTDADGRYELVLSGSWHEFTYIDAAGSGFIKARTKVMLPKDSDRVLGVDFVLHRPAPISGRVLDQHRTPMVGVDVSLRASRSSRPGGVGALLTNTCVKTKEDGSFRFVDTAERDYRLEVIGRNRSFEPIPARVVRGGDRVEIRVFREPPGRATMTAELVDHATGALVNATRAFVSRDDYRRLGVGIPSIQGRCSVGRVVADGLRPGRWRLSIEARGMSPIERQFVVRPTDADVGLRIAMGPTGAIEGVIDASAVASKISRKAYFVRLRPAVGRFVARDERRFTPGAGSIRVDGDARFRFDGVPAGRPIRILVSCGRMIFGECVAEVPFGGVARVRVRLIEGASIRVESDRVDSCSGTIVFRRDGASPVEHTVHRSPRHKCIRHGLCLPPGTYRWRVRLYAGRTAIGARRWLVDEGTLDAVAGEECLINLALSEQHEKP